jgi:hypothetical protein
MKRNIRSLFFACCILFSCSSTPEDYFGHAALNCNLLYGFAGYELKRDLATPSEKLVDEKTLSTAPMKRAEVVQQKLETVERNFKKVKSLSVTDDAEDLLNASKALYEYVLPVYRNEYQQLASLYDSGASTEKITAMEKFINEKYEAKFLDLYNALWVAGKAYAAKHGIKVMDVNPSPANK